ncbi:DUF983 domain-containing protein [Paracoccus sp. TK19116]|uniref:DUF983 domain-containing protein n=1 Tax=Paracoccus albicereus TaxID=2922394 RepID=A0ABT1MU40_9RHOB|nr:DUF983 domain-containing protein [Paracoccus albicereus]MCQ0971843.1 DUF983 domain-containing protein [Paracoccus albicereus]
MTQTVTSRISETERPTGRAVLRGALGRCPACGEGRIFSSFLKVRDTCPECGEALHHQRADDGPAYLTVLIVSHLCAPVLLWVFVEWRPSVAVMLAIFGIGAIVASLAMLPRIKGALVAFQWARRMHGFGGDIGPATTVPDPASA